LKINFENENKSAIERTPIRRAASDVSLAVSKQQPRNDRKQPNVRTSTSIGVEKINDFTMSPTSFKYRRALLFGQSFARP
jgi:hypothetical protein